MRKNRDKLQHYTTFEEFFEWALEDFNLSGDPGSHFRHSGYIRQRTEDNEM
jgi:hypothetical protein